MRVGHHWQWVPICIGICACSGSSASDAVGSEVDPGRPASEHGTKCYLELAESGSDAKVSFEECTVSAASSERVSHIYFEFRRLPPAAKRMYVSLVLGTTPLVPGIHASARAGAVAATLEGGREFSTVQLSQEGSFRLAIDEITSVSDHYYLTGSLEATLQGAADPSSNLRLTAGINRPNPR